MQFQRYNFILQILLLVVASSLLILIASKHSTRFNSEKDLLESNSMATLGGLRNSLANSVEIDDLGRFAVQEHNKKENAMLELSRVIKAHEQVVAGTMHHLTLEVVDAGKKKICEAKVWVKPWMDFKELHEFKHIDEKDNEGSGYESVPVHDPVVLDAANHIIKTLQQRSNSLFPYELQEVVHAKAETGEGSTKYDILVKLKRNEKEEKFKANVHKDNNGVFHVNNMEQDHS